MKRIAILITSLFFILSTVPAQITSAVSEIDWTKPQFSSSIELDLLKAGFAMPSARTAAVNRINQQLPVLIKDPLLSIAVDSSTRIGDFVLQNQITLELLTQIINEGEKTPSVYVSQKDAIQMKHRLDLTKISSNMITHTSPYSPRQPIAQVSSRVYTGIIIDARGSLPVHGEFVEEQGIPCLFPRIWDTDMNLLYEKNIVNPEIAKAQGIVSYQWTDDESSYRNRIGNSPLRISAREIFGINRTDIIISTTDALRILSLKENIDLLTQGKVVILLNKDNLIHKVEVNEKKSSYYVAYREFKEFYQVNEISDVILTQPDDNMIISIRNLQFIADSDQLLPEEKDRLNLIADSLKNIVKDNEFTILVEGHTASVGKPQGEKDLSIARARTIIAELVQRGLSESLFTYNGYGGTMPAADNSTSEGRAENRRVEITLVPKSTYIERK